MENVDHIYNSKKDVTEFDKLEIKLISVIDTVEVLIKQSKDLNPLFSKGTPKEYIEGMGKLNEILKNLAKTEKQLIDLQNKYDQVNKNITKSALDEAKARLAIAKAIQEETKNRIANAKAEKEELAVKEKKISLSAKEIKAKSKEIGEYKKFSIEVLNAKTRAKDLGAEMIKLEKQFKSGEITKRKYNAELKRLSKEFTEAKVKALGLDSQIKKLDKSVGDNQRNVGNYKSAMSGLATSFKSVLSAFGVVAGIQMFADLAKASFETVKSLDAQNTALKQIFETQSQVSFQKEYLADITNRLGLEIQSTTDGYTKFSAAIRGTSIEGEKGRAIFAAFSGASAKLGLNSEQQTGIFKALEQMISKGTVQAEELRGQLGDRMPGAFKLFADSIGVSTKELGKMMKDGKIMADDILPKVAERLNQTYNLNNSTKIDTLTAAQNRFKNSWTSFLDDSSQNKELINGLTIGMEALTDVINFLLDTLIVKGRDGASIMGDVVEILRSLLNAVGDISVALGIMDSKTKNSLFSLNQFKNDLKSINAVISVLSSSIKYFVQVVSDFFGTMFQEDGWDKFTDKFSKSADTLMKAIGMYNKVQDGIEEANKKGLVYNNEADPYIVNWRNAQKEKQAFFQLNGKYFNTKTGKNTGKSLDDYIDRGDQLVLKDKTKKDSETEDKKKIYGLTKEQRSYLDALQAWRDTQMAINREAQLNGLKDEGQYWERNIEITKQYREKLMRFLLNTNAKGQKISASVRKRSIEEIVKSNKEIFDYEKEQIESRYKMRQEVIERKLNEINNNEYDFEVDKIQQRNDQYNEQIADTAKFYDELLKSAVKYSQEYIAIEAKRDDEIGKIQDRQNNNSTNSPKAIREKIEYLRQIEDAYRSASNVEEQRAIISNSRLNVEEKEFALQSLLFQQAREKYDLDIKQIEVDILDLENKKLLTVEEAKRLAILKEQLALSKRGKAENDEADRLKQKERLKNGLAPVSDLVKSGFNDLGLNNLSAQFDKTLEEILNKTFDWKDAMVLAATAVADALTMISDRQKERTIANLDEQLKVSQENTDLEIDFIQGRLEMLNAIQDKTAEQITERNALEDEARTLREQQQQREKMIATQKAKAEQRAAAQQALINGALAATMTLAQLGIPAGIIPAAIALGFGVAQSAIIMTKNPVPQYYVGTDNARGGMAWTQERGAEIITDKNDNVKSYGNNRGAQLTMLNPGDKVYTAGETKSMMKDFPTPNWSRIATDSTAIPVINIPKEKIDYDLLAEKMGGKFEAVFKKYDKPSYQKDENGNTVFTVGNRLPEVRKTKERPLKITINNPNVRD